MMNGLMHGRRTVVVKIFFEFWPNKFWLIDDTARPVTQYNRSQDEFQQVSPISL